MARQHRNAFAAQHRAATLLERHPTAGPRAAHVLLMLSTFADGDTGRNARPSRAVLCELTGYGTATVTRALRRLVELGEVTRTNRAAHRGSTACYTINLEHRKQITDDHLSTSK